VLLSLRVSLGLFDPGTEIEVLFGSLRCFLCAQEVCTLFFSMSIFLPQSGQVARVVLLPV